jgi:hypothetical protein
MIRHRWPYHSLEGWLTDGNRYHIAAEDRVPMVGEVSVLLMIHGDELTYAATPSVTLKSIKMIVNRNSGRDRLLKDGLLLGVIRRQRLSNVPANKAGEMGFI